MYSNFKNMEEKIKFETTTYKAPFGRKGKIINVVINDTFKYCHEAFNWSHSKPIKPIFVGILRSTLINNNKDRIVWYNYNFHKSLTLFPIIHHSDTNDDYLHYHAFENREKGVKKLFDTIDEAIEYLELTDKQKILVLKNYEKEKLIPVELDYFYQESYRITKTPAEILNEINF